jgi:dihydropyrimidinase
MAAELHTAADVSPYEGIRVHGVVRRVLSRGRTIWVDAGFAGEEGWGQFVPQGLTTR